ncbi:Multidrug resistance protein EbrA [Paraburkholderia solisilvae]|uniref:Multidrug resistance protein EbrA n=2 Tax=Paraburkholderia solisilvae TaxID=624376 RepID=A0A6J5DZI3_9BURK|nr:Multidrug resistance protein EbrA [Paraburkholderia solisilvae]
MTECILNMLSSLYLAIAIGAEVVATNALRLSAGFRYWPAVAATATGYLCAFYFLGLSLRHIPIGAAYAIWSGAGTVLTVIIGYAFFRDSVPLVSLCGIALVVVGVVLIQVGRPAITAA